MMQLPKNSNFESHLFKVGIILPAFNEYENIFELLNKIESTIKNKVVIIVDDSNNDKIKEKITKKNDLHYFKRESKLGRGSAVLYGLNTLLKNKEINFFVEMDTDLSHDIEELPNNIKFFLDNKLDLLVSSRYLKESKIINWPRRRKLFSYLANKLARLLLKVPISDYTNGYRIYSRKAAEHVVKNCGKIGDGFIILSEILVESYINNLKINEIKSIWTDRKRGKSSVNLKLIFESLFGLIKLYLNKRKEIKLVS